MNKTIVILHGWRVEGNRYNEIESIFQKAGFSVFAPNLPGSGQEKIKNSPMLVDDYVDFVVDFLHRHKLKKVILVCHSFGGRVGAKLTVSHPELVDKLVLTGTPLIKQTLSLKKQALAYSAKFLKRLLKNSFGKDRMRKILYYLLGEWDYYKVPENIRETFKAVIAEDISPQLPKIKVPSIVIWGENDTFVPKKIGQQIATLISGAKYKEIRGATHKLPYENPSEFAKTVLDFIS